MSRLMSFSPLLPGFGPTLKSSEFISQNRLTTWTKLFTQIPIKNLILPNEYFSEFYIFFTISIALDFPIQDRFYCHGNFNIYFQLKKNRV